VKLKCLIYKSISSDMIRLRFLSVVVQATVWEDIFNNLSTNPLGVCRIPVFAA